MRNLTYEVINILNMSFDEEVNTHYRVERPDEAAQDDLAPPFVIIVQGSKESGKTTLIKSLVH